MSALLEQAKTASEVQDQTADSGGFAPSLPEEGKCPARFVGYVERGVQDQGEYQGKAKDPCMEVALTFECFGTKNIREIEVDGKKKKVGTLLRLYPMALKTSPKAKFRKLLEKMVDGRDITHMATMLDEVFLLTVRHKETKSGAKYATIQSEDGSWLVGPPVMDRVDPETGEIIGSIDLTEKTPQATVDHQLFIFDKPTIEQWESIYIDGTYKKKVKDDDGNEVEVEHSKNFIQETIKESLTWSGSPMQLLLSGLADDVEEEEKAPAKKKAPKKTETKKEEKEDTVKEELDDTAALLAECGL